MKNLKKEYEELLEVTGITPDWLQGVAKNIVSVINPEHWDGTGRVPENFSSLNVGRFYSTANPRFFIQVKKDANGAAATKYPILPVFQDSNRKMKAMLFLR